MSTWNKRAVQGALIRLDQTGMVKRFRARRKHAEDNWLTCIEVLREPRPEDHDNLKFRRQAAVEEAADEQSDEDVDGDTLMRDLEVDMLNSESHMADGGNEEVGRIPPQWVPERLLSNTLYQVIEMGGADGWDSGVLRDRIVGKFWRRPMESYLTRLTDDWEKTQPAHLRHLALIRDTRNTQEKKFVHYVYRTYDNFQKAVDAGEVIWAGVSKPTPKPSSVAKGGRPKKDFTLEQPLDPWGFRALSSKDFLKKDGSGSLSACRAAIVHGRKYGPRWDNALIDDIGYQKMETPKSERPRWTNDMSRSKAKAKMNLAALVTKRSEGSPATPTQQDSGSDAATDSEQGTPVTGRTVMGLPKRKHEVGLLTIEQRIALGLRPKGRLSKFVEDQIREHRERVGDPTSIPDSIESIAPAGTPITSKSGPLMTKEERIAAGLPARGRLGQKIEDQIREQRGLPKSVEKAKKPRNKPSNEPALLSKQQRIQFGIIPHGRLPQSLMEGLREEREFDISLEQSKVLQAYLGAVKDKKAKAEITKAIDEVRIQLLQENNPSHDSNPDRADTCTQNVKVKPPQVAPKTATNNAEKRRADDDAIMSQPTKRTRVEREASPDEIRASNPASPPTVSAGVDKTAIELPGQDMTPTSMLEMEGSHVVLGSSRRSSPKAVTPPRHSSPLIDLVEVDAKVRSIKDKYSGRSSPGVYVDPFAKRRVGKGRPRNAFIATFRLASLSELRWFVEAATENLEESIGNYHAVVVPTTEEHVETGVQRAEQDDGNGNDTSAPDAVIDTEADIATSKSDYLTPIEQLPAHDHSSVPAQPSGEQPGSDLILSLHDTATPLESADAGNNHEKMFNLGQPVQQPTRPVAGWNAINRASQPEPTYQSPYALSDQAGATSRDEVLPESDAVEPTTQACANEPEIHGVVGPITEADTLSRSARKLAAYMGTKTGGGSQKIFRHKIIMQIIDLCNGVYPMHGEIGRPFVTLWKQQHPDTQPPNSSTVLSNLRDMIADPRNGLKKLSFLIRLRQSAGVKKKDMVVYDHMTPISPQVTQLAYKMANYSNTKAHQYYPEQIRHLVSDESFYVPMPVAPKDETISLELLNPSLQNKIKEANLERRRRYYHKQKNEESARDAQNAGVEVPLKQAAATEGQPRARRTRLASLNDKNKRYRRAPLSNTPVAPMDEELEEEVAEEALQEDLPKTGQTLIWKKPWVAPFLPQDISSPEPKAVAGIGAGQKETPVKYYASSITAPIVRFYASNGIFSTEFGFVRESDLSYNAPSDKQVPDKTVQLQGKKRVRIIEPTAQRPNKMARLGTIHAAPSEQPHYVNIVDEESEDSYASSISTSSSDEDNVPLMRLSKAKMRAKAKAKAKSKSKPRRNRKDPPPTLLERLTGLTGDPKDPLYLPPKAKVHSQKVYQGWSERKTARFNKKQQDRKYAESHDPVDAFKKLCCTLVIASSMTGEDGGIDWNIVETVYNTKVFELTKTKALWTWMQANMAVHIAELAADFQARFLDAYEQNKIAAIEDSKSYDWGNLVRWAMHTCVYPELSLPACRDTLQQFIVDLSSFEAMDRPKWYREKIAERVRTQLQLQFPFTAPLQQVRSSHSDKELKARSWIRANTATPQALYDSKTAHEKLKLLGNPVLAKVVGDYVDRQMLRMRRLKRMLPGRNYTFTARLAKKYGRTFEVGDFMAAVKIKKEMDGAFAQEDTAQRFYTISRAEPDGAIMAIMSLLSDGKVKFVPKLPSVNSEFGAPLPRLSIWGFMEGDYVHRGIDRQRLFWDIHVVPTKVYDFGNPLSPISGSNGANGFVVWPSLPQPPLPGKHDSDALLPIWSSMDGQHITWPWWYRILNLVLQPLIFQPGATVEDIHANCDEYTIEIFEIELVLQWLVSLNAVKKTIGGGYITLPGVWAAFGDTLHDMEDDWLNTHVKRINQKHEKQKWRDDYHLRYSTMQGRKEPRDQSQGDDSTDSDTQMDDEHHGTTGTSQNIMRHPKEQYAIVRDQLEATVSEPSAIDANSAGAGEQNIQAAATAESEATVAQTSEAAITQDGDLAMGECNADEDMDAEGDVEL